jgi:hypothetical protein
MRSSVALLAAVLMTLSGCGGGRDSGAEAPDPAADNHGFGTHFDAIGAGGLRLRYAPHVPANGNIFTNPAHYEKQFAEVLACSGLSAPMPEYLILVDMFTGVLGHHPDGQAVIGRAFSNPTVLAVDFRWAYGGTAVKHEMLHHALLSATGDADAEHKSPLFARCAFL